MAVLLPAPKHHRSRQEPRRQMTRRTRPRPCGTVHHESREERKAVMAGPAPMITPAAPAVIWRNPISVSRWLPRTPRPSAARIPASLTENLTCPPSCQHQSGTNSSKAPAPRSTEGFFDGGERIEREFLSDDGPAPDQCRGRQRTIGEVDRLSGHALTVARVARKGRACGIEVARRDPQRVETGPSDLDCRRS